MSSLRRDVLLTVAGTFLLALPLQAAKPNDPAPNYPAGYTESPAEIGGKTYEQWKHDLTHPDPSVRADAIMVMPLFRQRGEDAVQKLAHIAQFDGDASPRARAVIALNQMGIRAGDRDIVVKALGHCVSHDPQTIIRYEAAKALLRFGPDSQKIIVDLVMGMGNNSTFEVRETCIMVIRQAGVDPSKGPDPRVTDALIARLNPYTEPTRKVRLQAIMALGGMGRPQDPNKLTQLVAALKGRNTYNSSDKVIKLWSHVALMALDDKVNETYLTTIVDYMRDRERDVRMHAVSAMGALGVKAHEHLREVVARLDDKEVEVVLSTCQALGRMGDRGERVQDALIKATEREGTAKDTIPIVIEACRALSQIGVASPKVIAALNKVLERKDLEQYHKLMVNQFIEDLKKPKDDVKPKAPAVPKQRDLNTKKPGR